MPVRWLLAVDSLQCAGGFAGFAGGHGSGFSLFLLSFVEVRSFCHDNCLPSCARIPTATATFIYLQQNINTISSCVRPF